MTSAKWEVHIMHIIFMLSYFAYLCIFFCIFWHVYAVEVNSWNKSIYLHIFCIFLHICFCIFLHIHAYVYFGIYLAYYAYFRNAYLCIFSFAYFYIFSAYICIWIFAYKCIFGICIFCIY